MSKLQKRLLLTKVKQNRTLSLEHLFSREVKFNMAVSIATSFRTSAKSTSISHNNRTVNDPLKTDKYHKHIDWDKTDKNIILVQRPIKEVYDENFGEAVTQYNAKQKRTDRQVKNYFEKVKKDKTLDLQREFIVQFGDKGLCEEYPDTREAFAFQLEKYADWFRQQFPDLKIYNAVIHMDEATPHLHMNVVPVATGYKQGITKRPSFSKWFKNNEIDFQQFREMQVEKLDELVQEMGAVRKIVGTHEYEKPSQYRETMQKADKVLAEAHAEASKLSSSASELKDEVNTLKNTKEGLKDELEALSDKYADSSSKVSNLRAKASELESEVNTLKNTKEGLEDELEALRDEKNNILKIMQRGREFVDKWRVNFSAKEKKTITGKKYYEVSEEVYQKAREGFSYQENKRNSLIAEVSNLTDQLANERRYRANLNKDNDHLKSLVNYLKKQNNGLVQRLILATDKLAFWRQSSKMSMPKKDFKEKSEVVNRYNPFKNIEKSKDKNIEKGLSR